MLENAKSARGRPQRPWRSFVPPLSAAASLMALLFDGSLLLAGPAG